MKIQSWDLKMINSFANILSKDFTNHQLSIIFKLTKINIKNFNRSDLEKLLMGEEFNQGANKILLFLIKKVKINLITEIINKAKYLLSKNNRYYFIEIKSKIQLSQEDKDKITESIIKKLDIKSELYECKFTKKDQETLLINEKEYDFSVAKKLESVFKAI